MRFTHLPTLAVVASLILAPISASHDAKASTVRHTHSQTVTNFTSTNPSCKESKKACLVQKKTKKKKVTLTKAKVESPHKTIVSQLVASEARDQNVPVHFALAIAKTESNFNCSARSHAGALGVMQIKRATAAGIGYKGTSNGLFDCRTGIKWGMVYLKRAIVIANGDLCTAAHLYFSGINAKRMTKKSRGYCGKVLKNM